MDAAKFFYKRDMTNLVELSRFGRMTSMLEFKDVPENKIKSSGYVVDSLEAAVWSLIATESFEEGLLRAVNLGGDTDTIGAIAGGLAGLFYGYNSIPALWRKNIIKGKEIIALCELIEESVSITTDITKKGKVVVSGKRTLEASEAYAKQGKKVCVLNFASATNPGGGVVYGSSAQEESICRCSTLYPCLDIDEIWDKFYMPHREADDPLYNNDCIYTPDVKVFKSDTNFPELLQKSEWWNVDVLTCAAPNLRSVPSNMMNPNAGSSQANITYDELKELLMGRVKRTFELAIANGAEVLILGAFGCGAFRNPPKLVAGIFAEYTKEYRKCFEVIEYAVFHVEQERANYDAFKEEMNQFL